jgi:prepilin-type N-terminal cleavage/methylation domain-containing protein
MRMKTQRSIKAFTKQRGFTLVEMLIAIAISGLLVGGVTMAIAQVLNVNAGSSSRMVAIKQVESAVDVLREDVIVAQDITMNTNGHILELQWVSWELDEEDTETHIITWDYDPGSTDKELTRTESIDGTVISQRIQARYIESITVNSYTARKIRLTVEARLENLRSATETRTFDILQRAAS